MASPGSTPSRVVRFGAFEADLRLGELRKHGTRVRLQEQPFRVLEVLLERPGDLVTREDLRQRLWPADTFVDFEHGLNAAVNRLRDRLGDDPDKPRFIETIPRRGYRFIAAIEADPHVDKPSAPPSSLAPQPKTRRGWLVVATACLLLIGLTWAARRWWTSPAASSAPIRSLAVLPLQNLSRDPDQEYFADGMTDELTTELAKVTSLRVISRTSVLRYKGTRETLPEIAAELNVDAIIEGSVLRAGNRVRITAQLVNARLDRHLWSESYDGDLGDVLDLQRNVARDIADRVESKLSTTPGLHRAVDPQVHDLYLRGLYQLMPGTPEGVKAAQASFRQVIARDPSYAPAYAQLATIAAQIGLLYTPPREIMPEAREYAQKALALDESLAEAHVALSEVHFWYDWDWEASAKEARRALEIDRNNADAHDQYGLYLIIAGQFEPGLEELRRAHELDPYSVLIMGDLIFWPTMVRQYDLAIQYGKQAIAMEPRAGFPHTWLGVAYAMKGQYADAIAEAETAHRLDSSPLLTSFLASIYARAGRKSDAERTLAGLNEQLKSQYSCSYEVAVAYVELGRIDEAFRWFPKAYDQRSDCMVLLEIDPRLDRIHNDPRYQALLKQMNFPH